MRQASTRAALVDAVKHMETLSPVESAACDRHLALANGMGFRFYFRDLVAGVACTKAFSKHVNQALKRLEAKPPR